MVRKDLVGSALAALVALLDILLDLGCHADGLGDGSLGYSLVALLLVDEEVDSSLHDGPREIETDSVIGQVLGEDLLLDDGELWLGTQYLGTVRDGSTIEILPTGVHVNGEFRGGLPYPHMRPASLTFPLQEG